MEVLRHKLGSGMIRYLGNPGFVDDLMYGVELDQQRLVNGVWFIIRHNFQMCRLWQRQGIAVCGYWIGVTKYEQINWHSFHKLFNNEIEANFDEFNIVCNLGSGTFGSVHLIPIKRSVLALIANDNKNGNNMYMTNFLYKLNATYQNKYYLYFLTEPILCGELYSLLRINNKMLRYIGYCPQHDALLKGLSGEALNKQCDVLLDVLSLTEYANKLSETFSGGTKRKLSVAMGLILASPGCGTFARRNSIAQRINPNLMKDLIKEKSIHLDKRKSLVVG